MGETVKDRSSEETELEEAELSEYDVTKILTDNGYKEVITDEAEIPLSMKIAAGAGIVATATGLLWAKRRSGK